ncbi:MAG TPA: metalloregulator ArsR/SmtB family transcription factor [Longilinea sp.]|nr:metalloregulator ArsR/SmtB family transcription factor [Longilinea sp.]
MCILELQPAVPGVNLMVDNLKDEVNRMHAQLCTGIADPNRILIIYTLAEAPKCVNDIAKALDLPQPTVSRHLKVMRENGIVRAERDGQTVVYNLADMRILQALELMRAVLADMLKDQARLATAAGAK